MNRARNNSKLPRKISNHGGDYYIGTDTEEISRFEKLNRINHKNLLSRIYSKSELDYCFSKSKPEQHLCARFSAKESVLKAINALLGQSLPYPLSEIEIKNDKKGLPTVLLREKKFRKYSVRLSMSHSKKHVYTAAIVSKKP